MLKKPTVKYSLNLYIVCLIIIFMAASTNAATLNIGSYDCKGGETINVPLTLKTDGENISSLGADINIDSSIFEITKASLGDASTVAGKEIYSNFVDQDTYRILIISPSSSNYISDGIIAYITIKIKDSISATKSLLGIESISGADSVGNYINISTISYVVLTNSSPNCIIQSGVNAFVFGSNGINTLNVRSGGKAECRNFIGENQIIINETSSNFTVKRSGAMVTLQSSSSDTILRIPASTTNQTIKFTTDNKSLTLVISNSGTSGAKVMLETLEVGLSEVQLNI